MIKENHMKNIVQKNIIKRKRNKIQEKRNRIQIKNVTITLDKRDLPKEQLEIPENPWDRVGLDYQEENSKKQALLSMKLNTQKN